MIRFNNENGNNVIFLIDRVDTNNADKVSEEINNLNLDASNPLVLDFSELNYVSSAGLRILLKISKTFKDFKIINVSNDVYDILEMTGFTTLMHISKSLREVSIEGLEVIGAGAVGKVCRLDEERIIKVNFNISDLKEVEDEREVSKKAFLLGIPTAIAYEVVKVKEGGYGSIYELLKSDCFNKLFVKYPENTDKYIKMYAELFVTITNTVIPEGTLPSTKNKWDKIFKSLESFNVLPKQTFDKLYKMYTEIEDRHTMIHGDYHIKNIMMQGDEPLLIDMSTVSYGHPIFEIGPFFETYIGYSATDKENITQFLGISQEIADRLFNETIEFAYKDRSKEEIESIKEKGSLLGLVELLETTVRHNNTALPRYQYCIDNIIRLVDKLDTLNF